MNAGDYVRILENVLLPFIEGKFTYKEHTFMQDNDPKHVPHRAQGVFQEHNINWWCTPPQSPDLNPIENLWHELKEYLRAQVKPRTQDELVDGIEAFWHSW